ncbi:MAG: hypothetical protein CMH49_00110, partial [Myxococcales bacterium]|nr:hypothetical protein [Myxococcales bacterium]
MLRFHRLLLLSIIPFLYPGCNEPISPNLDMTPPAEDSEIIEEQQDMMVTNDMVMTDQRIADQFVNDQEVPDQDIPDQMITDACQELGSCSPSGGYCEPGRHPECWAGGAPVCYEPDHPTSQRY